jgi:predicted amidohydrolase
MFDEQRYFATGDRVLAFTTQFGRMGILVCEDAWHLTCGCVLCLDEVEHIIAISSSPGRGVGTAQKLATAEAWERLNWTYAKFFGVYVIYANRAGFEDGVNFWGGSEIVSPGGEVIVQAPYHKEDLVVASVDSETVRRERIASPMLRDERIDVTLDELKRIKSARLNAPR